MATPPGPKPHGAQPRTGGWGGARAGGSRCSQSWSVGCTTPSESRFFLLDLYLQSLTLFKILKNTQDKNWEE